MQNESMILQDPFNNKREYKEGEIINFTFTHEVKGSGYIRGKALDSLSPLWLVEIINCSNLNKEHYPYSVIGVFSTQIDR